MRTVLGIVACALYAWRVYEPKESYIAFYDATAWLTGWLVTEDDFGSLLRNLINLVLLDQVEGFLLGIAFLAVLSAPIWAARKCAGLCWRGVRRLRQRRRARKAAMAKAHDDDEPLTLTRKV